MRLIDADEVMRDAEHISAFRHGLADLTDLAIALSGGHTIEAEPVRHGRWVDKMVRDWHCSECGKKARFDGYCYDDKPNYCPNCGAKMDMEV